MFTSNFSIIAEANLLQTAMFPVVLSIRSTTKSLCIMFDAFFTSTDGRQSGCLYVCKLFAKWVALSSFLLVILLIHSAKKDNGWTIQQRVWIKQQQIMIYNQFWVFCLTLFPNFQKNENQSLAVH